MSKELFRNKLMISSPTSISLGHITWFALDTKLVGRVKALLEERNNLQSKIDKAIDKINQYELIVGYYNSNYDEYDDTYSHEIKDELLDILKEDK